jgi:purine-binding chemotaxis protein CheW
MNVLTRNLYFILEVEPSADQREIDVAYRRLALLFHPDLNQSRSANLRMQEINEAYTILRHPEKRLKYDRENNIRRVSYTRPPESIPYQKTKGRYTAPPPTGAPYTAKTQTKSGPEEQVVLFYLDHSSYGLRIKHIEGILMMHPIAPDMRAPSIAEGVISARGHIIPVVDLRRHFGMRQAPVTRDSRIILGNVDGARVGLIVDSVDNYTNIPIADIDPSPAILPGQKVPLIQGIAHRGNSLIIILDLPALFSEEEFGRFKRV